MAVQVNTGSTPASLNGYMIIGPAPDALSTQSNASPFKSGNNQVCVKTYSGITPSGTTFTFSPALTLPNPGQSPQKFELTFVAEDSSGKQWEEDPEFDTGN